MCYNPQMSCDAIEKHNYGLKLLKEIKQVGVIETIDFTLSKWTPNRNLKEHVQSEYPLTSCFAVFFHFQSSFECTTPRDHPQVFFFFLLLTEAITGRR